MTRKFGHRWYHLVASDEAQAGDVIDIYDAGYRTRTVQAVHHGRKHHKVQTCAAELYPARWYEFRVIRRVWRKGKS